MGATVGDNQMCRKSLRVLYRNCLCLYVCRVHVRVRVRVRVRVHVHVRRH